MKKSKLLMPLAGIAAIGAISPIAITATSCSKVSASESDKAFLNKINDYMKYGETYVSTHKAITTLANVGCNVLAYRLSNPNFEFAFDIAAKKFIIMNGDSIVASPDGYSIFDSQMVFKFTNKYNKDSKYGQYLLDEYVWTDPTEQFDIKASIDVGNNTNIKNMKYVATNASKIVFMRTYCEYLTMDANQDIIYHMGESNNIEVYGTSPTNKCKYTELGRTSYMYASNAELQLVKLAAVDTAEIDVLENAGGVSAGLNFKVDYIKALIGKPIPNVSKKAIKPTPVDTYEKLGKAIEDGAEFVRLTADIELINSQQITFSDVNFILDLAGKKLIDKSTISKGAATIDISTKKSDTSVMFIDSWRSGEFILNDHFINIHGTDNTATAGNEHTATAYLQGANLTYIATEKRNGAIEVGIGDASKAPATQTSRLFMYGGKITAKADATSHSTVEVTGIYANDSAYIQVVYGAIYSSTNCLRSNGAKPHSYMEVVNGTFKTTSTTGGECIYMPAGKLNIVGGTFEGHCCIGIRGGDTTISGGYFHATGVHEEMLDRDTDSGIESDGSVFCIEMSQKATDYAYGKNPSLTIHNSTLQSDKSYILQIISNSTDRQGGVWQSLEVDFFGGVYYYCEETTSPKYNGVRMTASITSDHARINQLGGEWICTK